MDFPPKQPIHWSIPPRSSFKVNVDGATSTEGIGNSGVGVVIRDEEGRVLAALSKMLPSHHHAEWTELFAMEQGVLLAHEMEPSSVIFKIDALSVIQVVSV